MNIIGKKIIKYMKINLLQELQNITDTHKKALDVIKSTKYYNQVWTSSRYRDLLFQYHTLRLGLVDWYNRYWWFIIKETFTGNKKTKQKLAEYINLCYGEQSNEWEEQKKLTIPYPQDSRIGFKDVVKNAANRIKSDVDEWNDEKSSERR